MEAFVTDNKTFISLAEKTNWEADALIVNSKLRGLSVINKGTISSKFEEVRGVVKIAELVVQHNEAEVPAHKELIFSVLQDYFDFTPEDILGADGNIKVAFFKAWMKNRAKEL